MFMMNMGLLIHGEAVPAKGGKCSYIALEETQMSPKPKKIFALCFMIVIFLMVPASAQPTSGQPGSVEDPLVSKKYVDDQVNALRNIVTQYQQPGSATYSDLPAPVRDAVVSEALAEFELVYGEMLRQAAANASADYPPQVQDYDAPFFEVVYAESGKIIYGDSSTEIILRGGSATAVAGVNGLCDVTSGTDIQNGQNIPYNHLIIVPVGDGRGIRISSNAYLMIKGGYYFG